MPLSVVEISKKYRDNNREKYTEYQKDYQKSYIKKKNYYKENKNSIIRAKKNYILKKELKMFLNILL